MYINLWIENPDIIKGKIIFYEFQNGNHLNSKIWKFTSLAKLQIKFQHNSLSGSFIRNAVCLRDDDGCCFDCEILSSSKKADGYFILNNDIKLTYVKKLYVGCTDEKYNEFCKHVIETCFSLH